MLRIYDMITKSVEKDATRRYRQKAEGEIGRYGNQPAAMAKAKWMSVFDSIPGFFETVEWGGPQYVKLNDFRHRSA